MNPLPAAVLAALAICAKHTTAMVSDGPSPPEWECLKTATCAIDYLVAGKPTGWAPGYEKCQRIYDSAEKLQQAAAEQHWKAEEALAQARAVKAAAKDQPKLDAALKALN